MPAIAPIGKADGDFQKSHPGVLQQVTRVETGEQRRKNTAGAADEKRFDPSAGREFPGEKKAHDNGAADQRYGDGAR